MQLTHDDDPSCPLCEQNLSIARRKFLKNKFAKQQQFIEHRIARLARITKKLKPMLIEEHAQLEQIKLIIQKSSELIQLQAQFKEANEQLSILQKNLLEHKIKLEKHIVQEKETLENHADIKQLT